MTGSATRPCRACGRELVFATWPGGKLIPLSHIANVYVLNGDGAAEPVMATYEKFISHFVDCSDPTRFSKNRKEPTP